MNRKIPHYTCAIIPPQFHPQLLPLFCSSRTLMISSFLFHASEISAIRMLMSYKLIELTQLPETVRSPTTTPIVAYLSAASCSIQGLFLLLCLVQDFAFSTRDFLPGVMRLLPLLLMFGTTLLCILPCCIPVGFRPLQVLCYY